MLKYFCFMFANGILLYVMSCIFTLLVSLMFFYCEFTSRWSHVTSVCNKQTNITKSSIIWTKNMFGMLYILHVYALNDFNGGINLCNVI